MKRALNGGVLVMALSFAGIGVTSPSQANAGPASALPVRYEPGVFIGEARDVDKKVAYNLAELEARWQAAAAGFRECRVVEFYVIPEYHTTWFASVTLSCEK
ncbi:hypothetical protein [Nonomuraea sp. NPDC002799]